LYYFFGTHCTLTCTTSPPVDQSTNCP